MYTDKPATFAFNYDSSITGAVVADDADLFFLVVPANKEIEIQNLVGYVAAASDGADYLELVTEDNAILCRLKLQSTGHVSAVVAAADTAATFPIRVPPQSTTLPKLLKLRIGGAIDTSCQFVAQLSVSGLSAK
jgi:hypothetical protein